MAGLTNTRAAKIAAAAKLKERPLPPARVGTQGSEKNTPPKEAALPEPTKEAASPKPIQPKAVPEPVKKTQPKNSVDRRIRFRIGFVDQSLSDEAQEIALLYRVSWADLLRAIAQEVQIEAEDFEKATAGAKPCGETLRYELWFNSADAEAYIEKLDPLRIHAESLALRPVALQAFERCARTKLAALKKEK